ncbi:fasciclin domain-containing protein [Pseudonocardia sp.]|uniref:fasciclin domain-containing protein n=1 Tax=Pseudonocardia sp. TaxID=60912 RepID=UPI00260FAE42|nr:fasciclin domain-containing protein [Pseudonocardia sp.]
MVAADTAHRPDLAHGLRCRVRPPRRRGRAARGLWALLGGAALALAGCGIADEPRLPDVGVGPGTYGAACPRLPVDGTGFPGTAADLIALAAVGGDPLLSTTARALDATGLAAALDDPSARYTVFAPADDAFEALPAGTVSRWLAEPREELLAVMAHHVVVPRLDADALAAGPAGLETLDDQPLVVTGTPDRLVVDEEQNAGVLCGNITTTNATVFVVDRVLLPDEVR